MDNSEIGEIEKLREYINALEDEKIPLTKKQAKKLQQEQQIELPESMPKTKVKRQMSEKQKDAFIKLQEKRKANIEQRKYEKKIEASKLLLEYEEKKQNEPKQKVKSKVLVQESESDSEPEIIYVKKPKKKTKKIVIEESESESEVEQQCPSANWKSMKNKKSNVKVTESKVTVHKPPVNYFCD